MRYESSVTHSDSTTTFRTCSNDLLKLAFPIVLIQISLHLAGFVDTILIGQVGELELGATGLGSSLFFFVSLFGMGIVLGLDPMASQAFGAGKPREARVALWQGLYLGLMAALPLCFVYLALGYFLELAGVVPEVADETFQYVVAQAPSIVPVIVITASRSYLQAAHVTRPIIEASIIANVINFVADWILIYGDEGLLSLGLPAIGIEPQGVFGVALASTIVAVIQAAIMVRAIQKIPLEPGPGSVRTVRPDLMRKLGKVGLPVGLHMLAEVGFCAGSGTDGRLGLFGHGGAPGSLEYRQFDLLGLPRRWDGHQCSGGPGHWRKRSSESPVFELCWSAFWCGLHELNGAGHVDFSKRAHGVDQSRAGRH